MDSLLLSSDDRLLSIIGGVGGLFNTLGRFLFGALLDRFTFKQVMSVQTLILAIDFACIYWVGFASFEGFCVLILLSYLLSFSFFSAVPAQVMKLFPGKHSGVIIGAVGFGDSFGFAVIFIINKTIFTGNIQHPFVIFFIVLSIFTFAAFLLTWFVRESRIVTNNNNNNKIIEEENIEKYYQNPGFDVEKT